MKGFLSTLLIAAFSYNASAQKEIKLEEVAKHIGDSVTVKGKIFGGRHLAASTNSPTLLNMGAAYPNQLLTLVVWGKDRGNFIAAPEVAFLNKEVQVSGKVEEFKGKPQIIITSPKQIVLVITAPAENK